MIGEYIKYYLHRLFGYRLLSSNFYRTSYDKRNFSLVNNCPVIFDIGANIGQSVFWFHKEFPKSDIYAFEPFPVTYKTLLKNIPKNKSIVAFNCGISNRNANMNVKPYSKNEGTAKIEETSSKDGIVIECKTIDAFVRDNKIEMVDIIKIDTEGHEILVIDGARELLSNGRVKNIIIEASIFVNNGQHTILDDISRELAQYKYKIKSFYDLSHKNNGQLNYMNVHFVKVDE